MALEAKDFVALGALLVSAFSAYFAYDAKREAEAFAARKFEADKTIEILASAYGELTRAAGDSKKELAACFFIRTLAEAEGEVRREGPFFVRAFVDDVTRTGLLSPECGLALESAASGAGEPEPTETRVAAAEIAAAEATGRVESGLGTGGPGGGEGTGVSLGRWHALVASYNATEFGCGEASEDVARVARDLAGRGLDGLAVYVARTSISNHYVATVDAGDDRERAAAASSAIRATAPRDGTGADSFVQGNRGWTIDPACLAWARIGG